MAAPVMTSPAEIAGRISRIGLGTVKFGRNRGLKYAEGFPLPSDREVRALLDTAQEMGVTLLDTAPAYGESEKKLGRVLAQDRDRWVIATKVGEYYADGVSTFDFSAAKTEASLTGSLRRLRTDRLDLVLVHSTGEDVRVARETPVLETLAKWRDRGDIGAIGMSTKTVQDTIDLLPDLDAVMVTLNPVHTEKLPVIAAAAGLGRIVLIKKALNSGDLASVGGDDPAGSAIRFAAHTPGVTSVVIGTLSADHLRQAVAAAG